VQEKENEAAAMMHKGRLEQNMTCIDCHKGVAHREPDEPTDKKAAAEGRRPGG
jgi:cytochrome c-type protein NapC